MLQSHLHSLIAKAHRYQTEPERFELVTDEPFLVNVHGANGEHQVALRGEHLERNGDTRPSRAEQHQDQLRGEDAKDSAERENHQRD